MFGINPQMVSYALKAKLDEILNGTYPDGLVLKERTPEKITFGVADLSAYEGISVNSLGASVTYKGVLIIIEHGNN